MRLTVLHFGVLKDHFGGAQQSVEVPEGSTVAEVMNLLRKSTSNTSEVWGTLAVAVNREYAQSSTVLRDGDEVALLPPVSGGSGWRCA